MFRCSEEFATRRPETLHQVRKLIIKRRPLPLTAAAAVYRNEEAAAAGVLAALVSFLYFVSHTWVAFGWPFGGGLICMHLRLFSTWHVLHVSGLEQFW